MATAAAPESCESTEADGLEFAVLACPHTKEGHYTCTRELEAPPKKVGRDRAAVEDGGDEMEEVNCEGEIGDQLGSGDEKEEEDHTISFEMAIRLV